MAFQVYSAAAAASTELKVHAVVGTVAQAVYDCNYNNNYYLYDDDDGDVQIGGPT